MIFVFIYLSWIIAEFGISKREIHQGKKTSDYGTCELYAAGQALTILSALWVDSVWKSPGIFHAFGLSVFVSGIYLRLWAIRTLGRYYSHIVRTVDKHNIINSGPYRFIRHPAYAGMIIAHVGVVIYFLNYLTLAVFLMILLPAIMLRIFIEEKTLFTIHGYSEYAHHRKRLFPMIW
jgi:protein-S-isoprenylcysteine O-methyltransferase Ste14